MDTHKTGFTVQLNNDTHLGNQSNSSILGDTYTGAHKDNPGSHGTTKGQRGESHSTPLSHESSTASGNKSSRIPTRLITLNIDKAHEFRKSALTDTSLKSEKEQKVEKAKRYESVISRITDNIFVSGHLPTQDWDKLKAAGITHVINCARGQCGNYFEYKDSTSIKYLSYLDYYMGDSGRTDIQSFFIDALDFFCTATQSKTEAINSTNKVLIHCMQGVSRSCTLAVAILMHQRRLNFSSAMSFVKLGRPISNPNTGFQVQLLRWQKTLQYRYSMCDQLSVDSNHILGNSTLGLGTVMYRVNRSALCGNRFTAKLLVDAINAVPIKPEACVFDSKFVYVIIYEPERVISIENEILPSNSLLKLNSDVIMPPIPPPSKTTTTKCNTFPPQSPIISIWIGKCCEEQSNSVLAARKHISRLRQYNIFSPQLLSCKVIVEADSSESPLFRSIVKGMDERILVRFQFHFCFCFS